MTFSYEDLKVYNQSISFAESAINFCQSCPNRYSIRDQLYRAARSIPTNIAAGTVQQTTASAQRKYSIAIGSTLECAAALDIAHIYSLIDTSPLNVHKQQLLEIMQMGMGLRNSSDSQSVHESEPHYKNGSQESRVFHHEKLEVYQTALKSVTWVSNLFSEYNDLKQSLFKEFDSPVTTIVLNIAEGNGRFHTKDQNRFLTYARDATVKTATTIDLASINNPIPRRQIQKGKNLLERISAMLFKMIGPEHFE